MPRRIVAVVVVVVVLTVLVVHLRHGEGGNSRRCRCWRPVASFRASSLVFFFFFFLPSFPSQSFARVFCGCLRDSGPTGESRAASFSSDPSDSGRRKNCLVCSVRIGNRCAATIHGSTCTQADHARRRRERCHAGLSSFARRSHASDRARDRYVVTFRFTVHLLQRLWGFCNTVFPWSRVVLEKRKDIGRLVLFKTKFVIESIYIYIYIKYFMS